MDPELLEVVEPLELLELLELLEAPVVAPELLLLELPPDVPPPLDPPPLPDEPVEERPPVPELPEDAPDGPLLLPPPPSASEKRAELAAPLQPAAMVPRRSRAARCLQQSAMTLAVIVAAGARQGSWKSAGRLDCSGAARICRCLGGRSPLMFRSTTSF